jgi:hypothetical protein
MNKLTKLAIATTLVGTSATASAWSDSPQPPYAMPPVPFSAPALTEAQQAAISAQQQAFAEHQAQMMQRAVEAQRQAAERFAAHQQQMAKQWQERMTFDPLNSDPFASIEPPAPPTLEMPSLESPFGPPLPEHVKKAMEESNAYAQKRMDESNARFEKARKEMTAEREAMIKAMETRRGEHFSRPAPLAQRAPEKSAL